MESLLSKNKKNTDKKNRLNGRLFTFLICILVSIFFWLLMTLSKEYNLTVTFPVQYKNFPEDKVIANKLPEKIDIEIKSTGFHLLFYKFKQQKDTIVLDIKDARKLPEKNHYYLLCNSRIDKITPQFTHSVKVIRMMPDTVFLNYNKKISKKVPVKANLTMKFSHEYQETDSIRITPSMVIISGAADILKDIHFVETDSMNLKKVESSVSLKLAISKTKELENIEIHPPTVLVDVEVTKYTEATLELPIIVKNIPRGYSLKTFPDKVTVKFNVAFDDYQKINASQFKAVVDYTTIEEGSNKLKVELIEVPSKVRSVKLNVEKVEYIIRK